MELTLEHINCPSRPATIISIADFHRRIKYALRKTNIQVAIAGADFSFNEHQKRNHQSAWSPHLYVTTTTRNKTAEKGGDQVPTIRDDAKTDQDLTFENTAHRRFYALKTQFVSGSATTRRKN